MRLDKVDNYGNLLTIFRKYDKNRDGYVSQKEDPEIKSLDVDGDGRASLWELMVGVNVQRGKVYFTGKEIETVQESIQNMPDVSPYNILHFILALESRYIRKKDLQKIYPLFNSMLKRMKEEGLDKLSCEDKIKRVIQILKEEFKFEEMLCEMPNLKHKEANLYGLTILKRRLNPRSLAYTLMIISQELNWPLALIELPRRVALHWETEKDRFAFDMTLGIVKDFKSFKNYYRLSATSINAGTYLRPLWEKEFLANIYLGRAHVKFVIGNYQGSIKDLSAAISLEPQNIDLYRAMAASYWRVQMENFYDTGRTSWKYEMQIKKYQVKVEELDPDFYKRSHLQDLPKCKK